MKYIVDTNCLLNNPEKLEKYDIVITSHVLREIEDLELKRRSDRQLQYEIRRAKRVLDELDHSYFDLRDYKFTLDDDFNGEYVDNILIQVAIDNGYGMMTNDKLLREKCRLYGIEVLDLDKDTNFSQYTGYKYVTMSDEEMANFYEGMDNNKYNLLINQYLLIRDNSGKVIDKYRWDGYTHKTLIKPKFSEKSDDIKAENALQECAIDLLSNNDIPIKLILGTFGSGKTYLNTKMGLYHVLERGNQSKIMIIRNPIGTGEEIGFLSGDKNAKTEGFFKPVIQHLKFGEQQAESMEQKGQLIREIPYYLKGMSIDDTFIIVDEAEDLNKKLIKLIGTRLGENSVIAFSGDINQAEDKYVPDNGLRIAIDGLKGEQRVGIVILDTDVRSEASKLFGSL